MIFFLVVIAQVFASDTPDYIIVVSRHGVRRQFPSSNFDFAKYAPGKSFAVNDLDWGVEEDLGVLTRHGYEAVRLMGNYQGAHYKRMDLLHDCDPKTFAVYSEEDMPRDIKTAEAFFSGFFASYGQQLNGHTCQPELIHEGADQLIDQGSIPHKDGLCHLPGQAEVEGRFSPDELTRVHADKLRKLNDVLGCCDASVCPPGTPAGECSLLDIPHQWDPNENHWYDTFLGPVYAGKYFAEWFQLTMLNNMEYAFGKLTPDEVIDLASFVTLYRELEFDDVASRSFGSTLLSHITASIEQWVDDTNVRGIAHSPEAKVVYYAAHDTNLLYIAELLGLKWMSKGWQPKQTPPGGMLVFEVFRPTTDQGDWKIKAFFDVQTPLQIRELRQLSATEQPSRSALTIPGCSTRHPDTLECDFKDFRAAAMRAVDVECVLGDLEAFALSAQATGTPGWVFLVVLPLAFAAGAGATVMFLRADPPRHYSGSGRSHEEEQRGLLGRA